jgi:hypothetical protein
MILIDTSVWIDFLNGLETAQTRTVESLIQSREDICICGIVLTEILQGIKEKRAYEKTKAILSGLIFLPMERETFLFAATIYRTCRSRGITIRNSTDCMIAATCIQYGVRLLHHDKDFESIATQFDLDFVILA